MYRVVQVSFRIVTMQKILFSHPLSRIFFPRGHFFFAIFKVIDVLFLRTTTCLFLIASDGKYVLQRIKKYVQIRP